MQRDPASVRGDSPNRDEFEDNAEDTPLSGSVVRMAMLARTAGIMTACLAVLALLIAIVPDKGRRRARHRELQGQNSEDIRAGDNNTGRVAAPASRTKRQSQAPSGPHQSWGGSPGLRITFQDKGLYEAICEAFKDTSNDYFQRMLYSEIATTVEQGRHGLWTIPWSMARDGKPCEFDVQAGKWSMRTMPEDEVAAVSALRRKPYVRALSQPWQLPFRQLVTLEDPRLNVIIRSDGSRTLIGRIRCTQDPGQPVTFLSLTVRLANRAATATRDLFQPIYSNDLRSDWIDLAAPIDPDVDLTKGVNFHLQGCLVQLDVRFLRISNELVWTPDASP